MKVLLRSTLCFVFLLSKSSCSFAAPACVPYEGAAGTCAFVPSHHLCDRGAGSTPASAVSSNLKGTFLDSAARFDDVVNKKLACCLNVFTKGDPYAKYDCVDNSADANPDFNQLWASADDAMNEGGQMNALYLQNAGGKPITGFYTLSGARCNEFSEFAATSPIQPYKVDPKFKAGQQNLAQGGLEPVGAPFPLPPLAPYSDMRSRLQKSFPSNPNDYLRCPILVRAAMVAKCPDNPASPLAQKSYTLNGRTRCVASSLIQVHIRIEQLYEIAGDAKMPTFDTVREGTQSGFIYVDQLLLRKYGGACEPGTIPRGPVCVYP